jgi:hypothetical protein
MRSPTGCVIPLLKVAVPRATPTDVESRLKRTKPIANAEYVGEVMTKPPWKELLNGLFRKRGRRNRYEFADMRADTQGTIPI